MTLHRKAALVGLIAAASACMTSPDGLPAASDEALLELDAKLLQSMIVERDATLFRSVAVENFRVLAPGGLVEDLESAAKGVEAWTVESIEISGSELVRNGDVGIVISRLDIDGTMAPVGRWGPMKYVGVYQDQGGEWRFLSRSLTPCLPKLIEMGRC